LLVIVSAILLCFGISSYFKNCCVKDACGQSSCKTQEDWTEAYYKVLGHKTYCALTLYKSKPEYLKDKVPYPKHRKCYQTDYKEYYAQEGIDYEKIRKRYFSAIELPKTIESNKFKIPKKLNFVWVTSNSRTKEENEKLFYKHNVYLFHNVKITQGWQHIIWTNNIDWIPDSAKEKLINKNIKIRSIEELDIKDAKHKDLRTLVKKYAIQSNWVMSSDIARDLVTYYEGGIYVDGDYQIFDHLQLESYMKSYRSFFGLYTIADEFEIVNAFLASEAKGVVIGKKLDLIYRNTIDIMNAPAYIKYPCDVNSGWLSKTSPLTLTIAFYLKAKTSDALMPNCYLFPYNRSSCSSIKSFGNDLSRGTWRKQGCVKLGYDFVSDIKLAIKRAMGINNLNEISPKIISILRQKIVV
jgi:hypothetical protein